MDEQRKERDSRAVCPLLLALSMPAGAQCPSATAIIEGNVAMTADQPISVSISLTRVQISCLTALDTLKTLDIAQL